jgi:hypothetical protein
VLEIITPVLIEILIVIAGVLVVAILVQVLA